MGKVSTLTHFPPEPACGGLLLDQAVKDFEHGPHCILMDSVNTAELEVSFDEAVARPTSVSSGFPYLGQYPFWAF